MSDFRQLSSQDIPILRGAACAVWHKLESWAGTVSCPQSADISAVWQMWLTACDILSWVLGKTVTWQFRLRIFVGCFKLVERHNVFQYIRQIASSGTLSGLSKRLIRKRDNLICQVCGTANARQVHHINYMKSDNDPFNLITLCASCHGKTTMGKRPYWILVLTKQMLERTGMGDVLNGQP